MESWNLRPDLETLDAVIDFLAAPRWAWRPPRDEEAEPDEAGRCAIALRDECRRWLCLRWVYEAGTGYLWMLWAEQRRDTPRSEWAAVDWSPCLILLKENLPPYGAGTGRGRWRAADMGITERSREWEYLGPAELHALVASVRAASSSPDPWSFPM
jgi:hypothetical protein